MDEQSKIQTKGKEIEWCAKAKNEEDIKGDRQTDGDTDTDTDRQKD